MSKVILPLGAFRIRRVTRVGKLVYLWEPQQPGPVHVYRTSPPRHMARLGDRQSTICQHTAAIALSHNAAVNRRNKHIHVRYHFTRDAIHDGLVHLQHCPTDEMVADMFTKPLGRVKLQKFVAAAGMGETASAETQ